MARAKLGWVGTVVFLPLLVLVTAVGGTQPDADILLSVDLTQDLNGLSLDDVLRGELRVRWEAEGPRMFLDALRLDPERSYPRPPSGRPCHPQTRAVFSSAASNSLVATDSAVAFSPSNGTHRRRWPS